jgi:hypothetical protein
MTQHLVVRSPGADAVAPPESRHHVVVHGDFSCPWSYLASRRATVLAADEVQIDWRAVERDPVRWGRPSDAAERFGRLRDEMDGVAAALLPGEKLPSALAGILPHTRAAVTGYAEAYGAGLSAQVRHPLFEALWLHGVDLADARVVRTLLVDVVRRRWTGHRDGPPARRDVAARMAGCGRRGAADGGGGRCRPAARTCGR